MEYSIRCSDIPVASFPPKLSVRGLFSISPFLGKSLIFTLKLTSAHLILLDKPVSHYAIDLSFRIFRSIAPKLTFILRDCENSARKFKYDPNSLKAKSHLTLRGNLRCWERKSFQDTLGVCESRRKLIVGSGSVVNSFTQTINRSAIYFRRIAIRKLLALVTASNTFLIALCWIEATSSS